jgi:hypothetical protein
LVNNIETFRPGFIQVFERILDTVDNERTGKLCVMGKLESDANSLKKSRRLTNGGGDGISSPSPLIAGMSLTDIDGEKVNSSFILCF